MDLDGRTRVQGLVARPVVYVHINDPLRQLATTLREDSIGAALVRGPQHTLGLVSERDVAWAIADGADPDRVTVEQIMTYELVTVARDDELLDAVHTMLEAEVRHLPIMEDGVVSGIGSARDALQALATERAAPS